MTLSHCRQILGTACSHPATWNTKNSIIYDELIRGVKDGHLFEDYEFTLFEYDGNTNIIEVQAKGV